MTRAWEQDVKTRCLADTMRQRDVGCDASCETRGSHFLNGLGYLSLELPRRSAQHLPREGHGQTVPSPWCAHI